MNREDLYDALVGVCQQVGITAEATYESPHDAMDSSRMSPTKSWSHAEVYGHDEGYESRCRWRGNHEHRGARLARKSLAPLSHVRMEAKRRALDEIATSRLQPTRSGTARTAAACAAGGVHALQETAGGLASRYGFAGAVTGSLPTRGGPWQRLPQQRHRLRLPNSGFDSR